MSIAPPRPDATVTRSNDGKEILVSWTLLTLEQARGFVQYYIITLREGGKAQKRKTGGGCTALDSTCLAPARIDNLTITMLDPNSAYTVTVAVANSFGDPPTNPPAEPDDSLLVGPESKELTAEGESVVLAGQLPVTH